MGPKTDSKNLLECAYHWEKNTPDQVFFTQPMGGGMPISSSGRGRRLWMRPAVWPPI